MVGLRLEGARDLDLALQAMAATTAKNTARRAMAEALEPVLNAAKAMAPVRSGTLRDSLAISSTLSVNAGREVPREGKHVTHMNVGAQYGFKKKGKDKNAGKRTKAPHAHLVEFGTGPRHIKTGKFAGKFVGSMPPQPFMRPAWDANKHEVLARLGDALRVQIELTLARGAKASAKRAAKAAAKG